MPRHLPRSNTGEAFWIPRPRFDIVGTTTDMAQLIIKNLEDSVIARLHRRAIRHRRSLEEEVREILRSATSEKIASVGLGTRLRKRFAKIGLDSEIEEFRGSRPRPASFSSRPRES